MNKTLAVLALALLMVPAAFAQPGQGGSAMQTPQIVELPNADSPLVSIRLQFNAGSIYDPRGKEGLAALTALMVSEAGTAKRSYSDLAAALYPMAADINSNVDREVALFAGTVHRDTLADYTTLLEEVLLQPGFAESDFSRNKEQLIAGLTNNLRSSDEMLGLEMLQQEIFDGGHPYGHSPAGTVEGLQSLTLDDVKKFYKEHYIQPALMLGVAGGYPKDYPAKLAKDFSALPATGATGARGPMALPPAPRITGRNITLIEKETGSVGIHFGYPLPINRSDPDYYPLMVANSYLGEHRTFFGRLMNQLRGNRGLNYGDYSYIEYWFVPPGTDYPTPNVPRREQYFSVWIRPVVPADAQFALRAALYEVQRLHDQGMTQQEFEGIRELLLNYSKLWAQSQPDRLGFLMDSKYYGMPYYIDEIEKRLKTMTVDDVNKAIKKYISTDNWDAVVVTDNAEQVKAMLQKDDPSPKKYGSQVAPEVLEVDKTIQALPVKPTSIEIVPIGQVFQK